MPSLNEVTNLDVDSRIAVLTLNSPPVNALSANVREGLHIGVKSSIENEEVEAIVIICEGRTFIAGADISEFGQEPKGPSLYEVQDMIENSPKPIISAIHGTALGGGLEVALTCHYRIAVPSSRGKFRTFTRCGRYTKIASYSWSSKGNGNDDFWSTYSSKSMS